MVTIVENKVYTLPSCNVWDRYKDNRVKFNMMQNYHCKLATKCNYQVMPFDDIKGYTDTYYINDISELNHVNGYKLGYCNWTPNNAYNMPLYEYVNPLYGISKKEYYGSRTTPLYERGYNRELIGWTVNDVWLCKLAEIKTSKNSHTNYISCDFVNGSVSINSDKGYYKYYNGIWHGSISYLNSSEPMKRNSIIEELLQWFIDKLGHVKYKGFYDDVITMLNQI